MIKPEEFAARWLDREEEILVKFPAKTLANTQLPEDVKRFLTDGGLPDSAAPFLEFEIPKGNTIKSVSDEFNLPSEFERYLQIGFNGSGDPICIDTELNHRIVYLNHDMNLDVVLINSSISQLAESLLLFRKLVDDSYQENGEDAFINNDIPKHLIREFERNLSNLDPDSVLNENFWAVEIECLDD